MAMKRQPQPDQSKDHDGSIKSWTSGPIQCRLASAADYEEILEMSEGVHDGYDYLPLVFHQWLEEPNRLVFVAQLEEKLVGLNSFSIISGGTTCVAQALRIHPNYRRKRLASYLRKAIHDYIRRNYPSVKQGLYTTTSSNTARLAMQKSCGDQLVLKYASFAVLVNKGVKAEVFNEISRNLAVELKPCTRQDFHDVLLEKPRASRLFPGGCVSISWQPFEAIQSNIDYIFKDGDHVFVDWSGDGSQGERFPKAMSHGRLSKRVKCLFWLTTICTDDPVLLQANVLHQLKNACEVVEGDFMFYLSFAKEFQSLVKSILGETLKLEVTWECEDILFKCDLYKHL